MFRNLSRVEQVLRVALGGIMVAMGFQTDFIVFHVVGCVLIATGVIGYCPINAAAGLSDIPAKAKTTTIQANRTDRAA